MGTRSLVRFIEKEGDKDKTICNVYRQYDGYPDGRGLQLAIWLNELTLVNGIRIGEDRKVANGIGCLSAQWVAEEKDGAGGVYLYGVDDNNVGEEYIYDIREDKDSFTIMLFDCYKDEVVFDGNPKEYIDWVRMMIINED
jgi:hypothetical protein